MHFLLLFRSVLYYRPEKGQQWKEMRWEMLTASEQRKCSDEVMMVSSSYEKALRYLCTVCDGFMYDRLPHRSGVRDHVSQMGSLLCLVSAHDVGLSVSCR